MASNSMNIFATSMAISAAARARHAQETADKLLLMTCKWGIYNAADCDGVCVEITTLSEENLDFWQSIFQRKSHNQCTVQTQVYFEAGFSSQGWWASLGIGLILIATLIGRALFADRSY